MKKQRIAALLGTTMLLSTLAVSPVIQLNQSVYASEVEMTEDKSLPDITTIKSENDSELIESVQEQKNSTKTNTFNDENGNTIIEVLDENDVVLVSKFINNETNESETTTNNGSNVIVEKSTPIGDGTFNITKEVYDLVSESELPTISDDKNSGRPTPRIYYDGWTYTNLAVGKNLFAALTDLSVGAIVGKFAAVFGISRSAADFAVGYMGAKYVSTGASLAKHLDSNGNGWIALYKRGVRNSKQTPIYAYQHRTY